MSHHTQDRAPFGFRSVLSFTPEVEAHLTGLPLSDVLTDRARALELRQTWAEARARDMLAAAIQEADQSGEGVPDEFEQREDPYSPSDGGRRYDDPDGCGKCRGAGCNRCHGGRGEGWRL